MSKNKDKSSKDSKGKTKIKGSDGKYNFDEMTPASITKVDISDPDLLAQLGLDKMKIYEKKPKNEKKISSEFFKVFL